jgi:hypothetical protein
MVATIVAPNRMRPLNLLFDRRHSLLQGVFLDQRALEADENSAVPEPCRPKSAMPQSHLRDGFRRSEQQKQLDDTRRR